MRWGELMSRDGDRDEIEARKRFIEAVIRATDPMLVRWLTRKLGDVETARDVAQSAYLRVWRHAETTPIDNPQALIFKAAANLAANEFRARRRRRAVRVETAAGDDARLREIPGFDPCPEAELVSKQSLASSIAAIERLPEQVRRAFVLSRFEGLSYREIARAMRVSESSVEKYVIHALRALRENLESADRGPRVIDLDSARGGRTKAGVK
jgi:RNA polymerase sigma-70 factor (ECF subfamily)